LVAGPVGGAVEAGLAGLVGLGWDHRGDATAAKQPPRAGKRVALVATQLGGPLARPTPPRAPVGPPFRSSREGR
jgi:hypothetical protein